MWKETDYDEEEVDEDDFYEEDLRELLIEDDELTPTEAGFMQGYEEAI